MASSHNPNPAGQTPESRTIRLVYGSEPLHFGELHLPTGAGPHPVVILIHGGFWRVPYGYSLMSSLAEDLAQRGSAAWNIEYRRLGDPNGGWPATLLDVARATDSLRTIAHTYALDLQRVVTVGHSAGGHLALWLVARSRIAKGNILAGTSIPDSENERGNTPLALRGAVSQAGVSDLVMGWRMNLGAGAVQELLGGSFTDHPERYAAASPAALLPLGVPQVLIHGTADDRVPFEMSRAYAQAAQAAGDSIRLIELVGGDHFALINVFSEAWAITVGAVKELLHVA
ncbi:MAG TPA: alpha/beta hydrolase [Ktedonobacteraceae bacterium]|nr:alpha/beta hydrolase [Ktedonobacteraceae bacterium]